MTAAAPRWVAVTATEDFPVTLAFVRKALRGVAPVRVVPLPFRPLGKTLEKKFAKALRGAEGILLRPGYITPSLLDRLPDLRVIGVHGAGVDQVDVEACTERGVLVTNTPGANADSVAELTIGLMLSLFRRIPQSAARVRAERVWGEARHTGRELKGKTVGLAGIGQIGERVTNIAKAFGMKVIAHDPGLSGKEIRARGARPVKLDALLAGADILSLHAPHIPATHHLIGPKAIAKMKKGAFLVNAARGPLIDERALARALRSGRLGGAALDVLEGEPPDPESPIFGAPNVILTPHMAGSTLECLEAIARTAGEDIARVIQGKRAKYPVNKPARKRGG
ncbi:MAG TPA: 3-phosphoglycerate dehydrogenase [Nitrospinae bacterium]|nr:3-phosphoglycerate dehydrogenase [Nitrospinota bacterium]